MSVLNVSIISPILAVTVEKASPMGDGNFRNRSAPPCASSTVGVVKMTPLSFIPGAKITKYLGIINMFFIRETTSLREVTLQNFFCLERVNNKAKFCFLLNIDT